MVLDLAAERNLIEVDSMMETNIKGVYAIGDGVTYPGKVALIAAGFGEAPTAVTALAKNFIPISEWQCTALQWGLLNEKMSLL
ncbi:ferredoxin--NADP reductase [Limosilactobacillus reuteri]|uniref:Ferredoxin--NADP reductase n=1 Tax=Limosilactobacillus reuteri TaxID=1598 RepID=A0A2S1ETC3_LIMRT|nr:ferredoxin--NADP reductase [Limosilactobacillus reuteri]